MLTVTPRPRNFLPSDLAIKTWADIESFAKDIETREIASLDDYQKFLDDYNELDGVTADEYWLRYTSLSCHTDDEGLKERFEYFTAHITPQLDLWKDNVHKKLVASPFAKQITEPGFALALRNLQTHINIFRTENLSLKSREEALIAQSGAVRGEMLVTLDGEQMTLQAAGNRLFWTDRDKREEAWRAMAECQYQAHGKLDDIFDELVKLRHQMAVNAGFENYRDYMFAVYNRHDYTPQDCYDFHDSILKYATPLFEKLQREKAAALGLEKLRPWDRNADPQQRPPIKAFESIDALLDNALKVFSKIDPAVHDTLLLMRQNNKLDLDSRKGKRPGGYMQTFLESKIPFVFGNFTQKEDDIITLVHETGHALHDILVRDLRLNLYRLYPMETAELASMSLELLSLDHWDHFFADKTEMNRAKKALLERIIWVLPAVAQLDIFQQEIYLNPDATKEQRHKIWQKIQKPLVGNAVDWSGLEKYDEASWQNKTHPFDVPLYYVEYGMAQLGALQIWRNYNQNPQQAIEQYIAALSLGNTKTIPAVFAAAGIKFDFSAETVQELMAFVEEELSKLD